MSIVFYLKLINMIISRTAISGTPDSLKDNILNLLQMLCYAKCITDYSECSIWFEASALTLCSDIISHLTENGIKITARPLSEANPQEKSFSQQFESSFPKVLIILFPDQEPENSSFKSDFQNLTDKLSSLPTPTLLFAASTNKDLPLIKSLHSCSTLFQNGRFIG
ncbi:MAG: hypothetical protein J5527_09985 [Treponema sp.]|nr:hypothetical protein [Treponema sp.]